MSEKPETYQQLVDRIAYGLMFGIARGQGAQALAHTAVQQSVLWHSTKLEREAAEKKTARKRK